MTALSDDSATAELLVAGVRAGDEAPFTPLVAAYHEVAHAVGCVAPDGSAIAIMVDRDGRPPTVDVMIVPTDGRPATRIPNGYGWVGGAAGCSWQSRRP